METKTTSKPITLVIFEDPEAWLRKNLPDLSTDNVAAVYPVTKFNPRGLTSYEDKELADETKKKDEMGYYPPTRRQFNMERHVEALRLLCEQIGHDDPKTPGRGLYVGGVNNPYQLIDPGNWDAEVVDAYYQLVFHGEVIYG